jgi:hypothetical protein
MNTARYETALRQRYGLGLALLIVILLLFPSPSSAAELTTAIGGQGAQPGSLSPEKLKLNLPGDTKSAVISVRLPYGMQLPGSR